MRLPTCPLAARILTQPLRRLFLRYHHVAVFDCARHAGSGRLLDFFSCVAQERGCGAIHGTGMPYLRPGSPDLVFLPLSLPCRVHDAWRKDEMEMRMTRKGSIGPTKGRMRRGDGSVGLRWSGMQAVQGWRLAGRLLQALQLLSSWVRGSVWIDGMLSSSISPDTILPTYVLPSRIRIFTCLPSDSKSPRIWAHPSRRRPAFWIVEVEAIPAGRLVLELLYWIACLL